MADYVMEIDTLLYDSIGTRHSVCHVTGQVYAIACRGAGDDGYVHTVSIDTDGSITALDSLEFADGVTIDGTKIIHLAGDNYAILYNGRWYDARIATVSITSEGVIALIDDQPVDSIQLATYWPCFDFIKVAGTTYAIIYAGEDGDGFLTTLSIADDGTIGSVIQTWEFDEVTCGTYPSIIHISGDIFAISYYASGTGKLATVDIDSAGTITTSFADTLDMDTVGSTFHPRMIHLAGTKCAIVYWRSSDTSTQLVTVDIQTDGTIADSLTDTKEVYNLRLPSIVRRSDGVVFITGTYRTGLHAYVRGYQVEIADDGTIGDILRCYVGSISYYFGETSFAGDSYYYATPVVLVNGTSNIVAGFAYVLKSGAVDGYIDTIGIRAEVTTQASSAVGGTTAIGNGNVTKVGEPLPTQHGHCWSDTDTTPDTGDEKTELGAVAATGAFTSELTELVEATLYYVRAYVINGGRTTYGDVVTFTTLVAPPTVTTNPATAVEATAATGNGNITDNGGEDCDERGFVYNTSPHGDPGDTAPADSEYSNYIEETGSFGTGAFTGALTSLEPKTTYYIRAYAHNSAGYSYGNEVSFTTLVAIPTVTTKPATSVGETTSARLNGILDNDGGEACACGFEYGLTIGYGTTTPTQSKETDETFSQIITGLSANTLYHFRAIATNSAGTSHGDDATFIICSVDGAVFATQAELDAYLATIVVPSVTTNPATEVSILNGTLDDDGGEACDCGFEWGATIAYGNVTLTQRKVTGETFAYLLGGLSPAATYHFRAFATNSRGTSYGADQSLTTPAGLPVLTTEAASAIGLNEATLNGALTSDGGEPCYCGFEWGETIAYGTTTPTQRKVTGEVFSQPILNLGEATHYHFRAFATNSSGTAYGDDRTIDTLFRINKAYALARYEV